MPYKSICPERETHYTPKKIKRILGPFMAFYVDADVTAYG